MRYLKHILISLLILLSGWQLRAQIDTAFWFVAPNITEGHGIWPGGEPIYFRISAMDLPATVTITQPANAYHPTTNPTGWQPIVINVPAGETRSIDVSPRKTFLQNYPGGAVLNKGIHISSTNLVTVYYDEDEYYNMDIYSLKGKNALGREFYVPFNNQWPNPTSYTPLPYSALDIVATEDNTTVTITPTGPLVGPDYAGIGVPFTIMLDKGETYSCLASSRLAADHLGGTHVVSSKPIAISTKDDSTHALPQGCRDLIGDQMVPVDLAGYEYIIMRGMINLLNPSQDPPDGVATGERIFITATQPNTQIFIDGVYLTTLVQPGAQAAYQIIHNSTYVVGDKPIMILHAAGFGCELGGAIVPTIDGCTGSLEVSFTRSNPQDFFLNIMTRDPAKDAFTMHYEDGSTFNIPVSWFEPVGTTGWVCLTEAEKRFNDNLVGSGHIPMNEVVKVTNSKDVFHLGLINGGPGTGCKYGYFSNFNELEVEAVIVETGSDFILSCAYDTVQLRARGGLNYHWVPSDYLSDEYSPIPQVTLPPGTVQDYTLYVTQPCYGLDSLKVRVMSSDVVDALFTIEDPDVCSPHPIQIHNYSQGATLKTQWDWDLDDPASPLTNDPSSYLEHVYTNTGTTPIQRRIQLLAMNNQGCADEQVREVIIYPEVHADFTPDITEGCHPLTVEFTNNSSGHTDRYRWEFGDGASSTDQDVTHTYENITLTDQTYPTRLIAISPYECRDTAFQDIEVYPFLEANYAVDTLIGCAPFTLNIYNNSMGYIEEYEWNFGDGATSNTSQSHFTHTYQNTTGSPVNRTLRLIVKNNTRGCMDTLERVVTIYPQIIADFMAIGDTIGCNPLEVEFMNLSNAMATSFNWEFGDGGSSTQSDPDHVFENMTENSVNYTVQMVGTSPHLCRDTAYQTVRVHPYILADFTVDEYEGCSPFTITVSNSSEGAISDYEWEWNDGTGPSGSGAPFITHIYENNGTTVQNHNLRLIVNNIQGCEDTLTRNVTVYPKVNAQFTPDVTEGCNPLQVQFTNGSNPVATSFIWDFGDGGSSSQRNPLHTFENQNPTDVTYTTRLVAYSDYNCTDTVETDITVYSFLEADFTIDETSACTPFEVEFHNASVGGVRYEWDFGDSESTTVYNTDPLLHVYTHSDPVNSTTYTPVLRVYNGHDCVETKQRQVEVFPVVTADFTVDKTQGCHPLTVQFTDHSSGVSVYDWDFRNGESSDGQNPVMTFENFSLQDTIFNVRLITYNDHACSDTMIVPILVHPFVDADFTLDYASNCSPFEITMHNSSINGETFDWIFSNEDGYSTTSMVDFSRTFTNESYTSTRNLTISLLVTSPQGCTSDTSRAVEIYHTVEADFDYNEAGCHPLDVVFDNQSDGGYEYNWEFGDRGSSVQYEPTHTYTNFGNADSVYTIKLLVSSEDLCRDSVYKEVTVYPKPKARFEVDNSVNCPPFEVTIENISETGSIYSWSFGDGDTQETYDLSDVQHTYYNNSSETQTYLLRLDVESEHQCTDYITQNINVYPSVIADFTYDPAGCDPFLSEFHNTSVRMLNYTWDFDDGTYSALTHPTHVFVNEDFDIKEYQVKLRGSSTFGCADSIIKTVTVYPSPLAEFDIDPVYQTYPDATVAIDNQSKDGYWNYSWNFGDGNTSTTEEPGNYTYDHWGVYNITLRVYNDYCSHAVTNKLRIYPAIPIAEFIPDKIEGCVPLTVYFENLSQYAEEYSWEFDDGSSSVTFEPVHIFEQPGIYRVKLYVSGEGGDAFQYRDIVVYRKPVVDFRVEPGTIILPDDSVRLFNFSDYGVKYLWDFGDGTTSEEKEISHYYQELGIYDIKLKVWTEHFCTDSLILPEAVTVIGKGEIRFPNAFVPNPNGPNGGYYSLTDISNEVFHPVHDGVVEYTLQIYNRWGELIFESNDVNIGWDGYYNGTLSKQDVYVYKAKGRFSNGKEFKLSGDVTLLR